MNKEEIYKSIEHIAKCEMYDVIEVKYLKSKFEELEKQNQKYKEVFDKVVDKLESLRDFIRNESDYIVGASEIIVNITTIINILKEVE